MAEKSLFERGRLIWEMAARQKIAWGVAALGLAVILPILALDAGKMMFYGRDGDGTVTEHVSAIYGGSRDKSDDYIIQYDGRRERDGRQQKWVSVRIRVRTAYEVGDKVPIRYIPGNGHVLVLEDDSWWAFFFGALIFTVSPFLFVYLAYRAFRSTPSAQRLMAKFKAKFKQPQPTPPPAT